MSHFTAFTSNVSLLCHHIYSSSSCFLAFIKTNAPLVIDQPSSHLMLELWTAWSDFCHNLKRSVSFNELFCRWSEIWTSWTHYLTFVSMLSFGPEQKSNAMSLYNWFLEKYSFTFVNKAFFFLPIDTLHINWRTFNKTDLDHLQRLCRRTALSDIYTLTSSGVVFIKHFSCKKRFSSLDVKSKDKKIRGVSEALVTFCCPQ